MLKIDISGETMIFRSEKGFYSTSLSKKKQDGSYDSAYINVAFKGKPDIANKTLVNIKQGFLTFDNVVNKTTNKTASYYKIFVMDYEIVGENKVESKNIQEPTQDDDDLPF